MIEIGHKRGLRTKCVPREVKAHGGTGTCTPGSSGSTSPIVARALEGDHDVFGDDSVRLIATPGHTPGHQSLLVKLPKTGSLLLSGDAVHFKDNWENRRVPDINFNKEQTVASLQRMAEVLAKENAQLWINHDKARRDSLKMAPEFYD
jgi:N-acyl homoserine lactone hydrolase